MKTESIILSFIYMFTNNISLPGIFLASFTEGFSQSFYRSNQRNKYHVTPAFQRRTHLYSGSSNITNSDVEDRLSSPVLQQDKESSLTFDLIAEKPLAEAEGPVEVGQETGEDTTSVSKELLLGEKVGLVDTVEASSPPLTFQKYLTMQEKRVPITIRYSEVSGLRQYYLTAIKKIKSANPDVIIERVVIPIISENAVGEDSTTFEILVDGKIVIGKSNSKFQPVSRSGSNSSNQNNMANGMSVFVSMEEVNTAISKARRKRRPTTVYAQSVEGDEGKTAVRLEMLRRSNSEKNSG